jgi:ATP-binding cassette subfamily F protein 3
VAEATHLKKNYGEKQVLTDVNFTIERGDRIALVGANGAGKSTLVRLLSGEDQPTDGTLKLGHNVLVEYFAQDQYKVLDHGARMLDDISRTAPKVTQTELRSLLGCFLFSGDDVFKPLGVLSGGERNRYALARILVSPANFLLLDEPTNHLDLRAKDVLLEAVQSFTGTVLFVSHDRYFIDRLATRVFEVENGTLRVFPGGYEDYIWRKEGGPDAVAASLASGIDTKSRTAPEPAPEAAPEPETEDRPAEKQRRMNPIKMRQLEERVFEIEHAMPRLEAAIIEAEAALGIFVSIEETKRVTAELASLRDAQSALTGEWEALVTQLEEASTV